MKKILVVGTVACMLALVLAGCSSGAASSASSAASAASGSSASSSAASAASDSTTSSSAEAAGVGLANPWSGAASAKAAAEGAGLDGLILPEGVEISLGTVEFGNYRYMEGIAEATADFPAVMMTVRKGLATSATEETNVAAGDISGDYTEYANTWTQDVNGVEVVCYGNREGEATKSIWTTGTYCYSINVLGLGGDTDYGLSASDLSALVGETA